MKMSRLTTNHLALAAMMHGMCGRSGAAEEWGRGIKIESAVKQFTAADVMAMREKFEEMEPQRPMILVQHEESMVEPPCVPVTAWKPRQGGKHARGSRGQRKKRRKR